MYSTKTIAVLALAGSAIAAPHAEKRWGGFGNGWWSWGSQNNAPQATNVDVVTQTTYVYAATTPTRAASSPAAPAAVKATPTPAPEAAKAAPASPPSTNDGTYMSVVSQYRQKMGMSELSFSQQLQDNALKTVQSSSGQMVHQLNPGSFAQVLAPGKANEFEKCFVGGWLCEKPSLPGLGPAVCDAASKGWSYDGTGHADILTSPTYKKIGCANYQGIWSCDLA